MAKNNDELILARGKTGEVPDFGGLTGLIADKLTEIGYSREILGELDIILARAKYSCKNRRPTDLVNDQEELYLDRVHHPY